MGGGGDTRGSYWIFFSANLNEDNDGIEMLSMMLVTVMSARLFAMSIGKSFFVFIHNEFATSPQVR